MSDKVIEFMPFGDFGLVDWRLLSRRWVQRWSMMKYTLWCSMFTVLACCGSEGGQAGETPAVNNKPDIILESVQIGNHSVQFYINFGADSAILGFSVKNGRGQQRYFPIYGSTYRDIPSVTLDIFTSDSKEEMWVFSSWSGYEMLAYYRMGADRCMTQYGEITSFDKPTPEILGGGIKQFPHVDINKLSKIATLKYGGKDLDGVKIP